MVPVSISGEKEVEVRDDGVAWSADRSHFVGSTMTLPRMAAKLDAELRPSSEEVQRMIFENPRALGL